MSAATIQGRVIRLSDDVNTDVILPGAYLNLTEPADLGEHLLETYDPTISAEVAPGDILVAGQNFGSGSSREQAVVAIQARGVQAVISASFARIFLRNAVNLALPSCECPQAWAELAHGDQVTIDWSAGEVSASGGRRWSIPRPPPFLRELTDAGGLVAWTQAELRARRRV